MNEADTRAEYIDKQLEAAGWKVLVIWECAVSKKKSLTIKQLEIALTAAFKSSKSLIDIRG